MVCREAARALVPGMSSLDNSTLGLHHEALGDDLRPQELLSVLPSARAPEFDTRMSPLAEL